MYPTTHLPSCIAHVVTQSCSGCRSECGDGDCGLSPLHDRATTSARHREGIQESRESFRERQMPLIWSAERMIDLSPNEVPWHDERLLQDQVSRPRLLIVFRGRSMYLYTSLVGYHEDTSCSSRQVSASICQRSLNVRSQSHSSSHRALRP